MGLTSEQIERYSRRQILLPQVGGKDQKKLLSARVLIVGAGGLGSPVASYLAGAGVGTIGIVDSDKVELSNLHRQIIYSLDNIGKNKADVVQSRLQKVNPNVKVIPYVICLTSENITGIIKDYDIIIDGSDNFPTRYLVNDACVLNKKILLHGAFFRYEGQAMVIKPGEGPCYRCMFSEPPPPGAVPSCREAGVLGALAGVIGLIQATETLKYILEIGKPLIGSLIVFNALEMSFRKVKVLRDENCSVCGKSLTITQLIDYEMSCSLKRSPRAAS